MSDANIFRSSIGGRSVLFVLFVKQKTAYELRISDWSSDVCSSDLPFDWDSLRLMAAVLDRRLARLVGGGEANRAAAASAAEIVAIIRDSADQHPFTAADATAVKIGRASCRERECQYV